MEKTIIKVDHSVRKEIMKTLGCSYPTIRKALNGESFSDLSRKIRRIALVKGGVELTITQHKNKPCTD